MALLVRRPSDWSIVLRTHQGQQISFDRSNRRISTTRTARAPSVSKDSLQCPLCHQALPGRSFAPADNTQSNDYIDPEYFGLLATCLEEESALGNADTDDHLKQTSFNQGYFERFFVAEGLLGRGGRGEVLKVTHVLEGISLGTFALKRITVGDSQTWLVRMLREVQSLRFKHINLVSYNHVWLEHSQINAFGPTVPVLHILQQYCSGGDLETYVLKACGKTMPTVEELKERSRRRSRGSSLRPDNVEPGLNADLVYSFFKDILSGVAFLHEQGMIHRDLKPSNCLLDCVIQTDTGFPRVLVSDFGEAQFGQDGPARTGGTGTLSFTAPEIVKGQAWSSSADMFSLGLILYYLTHEGNLPYRHHDDDFDNLKTEIIDFAGYSGGKSLSSELDMVLRQLLSPDPGNRPSCGDLIAMMQIHDAQVPRHLHTESEEPLETALLLRSKSPITQSSSQRIHLTPQTILLTTLLIRVLSLPKTSPLTSTILNILMFCISVMEEHYHISLSIRILLTFMVYILSSFVAQVSI